MNQTHKIILITALASIALAALLVFREHASAAKPEHVVQSGRPPVVESSQQQPVVRIAPVGNPQETPRQPDLSAHFTVNVPSDAPVNSFLAAPVLLSAIVDQQKEEKFYIPLFYAHSQHDLDAVVSRKTEIIAVLRDQLVNTRAKVGIARLCQIAAGENSQSFSIHEYLIILGINYNSFRRYDYVQAIAALREVMAMNVPVGEKDQAGLKTAGWDIMEADFAFAAMPVAP